MIPADADVADWEEIPKGHAGSALFYNLKHPDVDLVKKAFGGEHVGITDLDIGRALGYPTVDNGCTVLYSAKNKVPFAAPDTPVEGLCCIVLQEYCCGDSLSDAQEVGRHFRKTADALSQLGLEISVDLEFCEPWGIRGFVAFSAYAFPGDRLTEAIESKDILLFEWIIEAFRRGL